MEADKKWRALGWRHAVWDLVRYYCSLRGPKKRSEWLSAIEKGIVNIRGGDRFPIDSDDAEVFLEYMECRSKLEGAALRKLRTEAEALKYCSSHNIEVGTTSTRSKDHHQSSKSMVATVSAIASQVAGRKRVDVNTDPQTRCVWCAKHQLHVTARNLDGALPGLANPTLIWEIKEYWGKTKGGSKMSDAVYECNLVGRELREFEDRSGASVSHVVFVDGKSQWGHRVSDLVRLIDLFNQGLIDHLIIGRDVQTQWKKLLSTHLDSMHSVDPRSQLPPKNTPK